MEQVKNLLHEGLKAFHTQVNVTLTENVTKTITERQEKTERVSLKVAQETFKQAMANKFLQLLLTVDTKETCSTEQLTKKKSPPSSSTIPSQYNTEPQTKPLEQKQHS